MSSIELGDNFKDKRKIVKSILESQFGESRELTLFYENILSQDKDLLSKIFSIINQHFDLHKRYGKMTDETEMRFEDILNDLKELFA